MGRGTKSLQITLTGVSLLMLGAVFMICALPVFSHTREEVEQVPRSEVIIDQSFALHRFEDKIAQVQLSIGQSLHILSEGSGNFSFSVVNFTNNDPAIQPDQPDVTYLSLNDTTTINTTWSPQTRIPEPGDYYLVFLAHNASPDSPIQIYANVTKTWNDLQFKSVVAEDRIPLLDQRFAYIGGALVILGTIVFSVAFRLSRRPRRHTLRKAKVRRLNGITFSQIFYGGEDKDYMEVSR